MAEEQSKNGMRTPWTKIFTAFKVALDLKKLILAAGGILAMWLGWWVLSAVFFETRSVPQWKDYEGSEAADKPLRWKDFKEARKRWNLLNELAGRKTKDGLYDAADISATLTDFQQVEPIIQGNALARQVIEVDTTQEGFLLKIKDKSPWTAKLEDPKAELKIKKATLSDLIIVDGKDGVVMLGGVRLRLTKADDLIAMRAAAKSDLEALREAERLPDALRLGVRIVIAGQTKPYGRLRTSPWFEDRGSNPYLLVTGSVQEPFGQVVSEQIPVLLEPLVKFLSPVLSLFSDGAGGWNRIYLILVILWFLIVWGLFGGAITRIAAVQIARNERVGLRDAFMFAKERLLSYFSAPVLPLIFLGVLTFFLIVLGFLQVHTYFVGDIVMPILFWPLIIVFGLVMAVVLVGLVGYPLMNPTISTEGSDSFDALSRSYSYVYQAPWQYIWYGFLTLLYGMALVFFVGFMASFMVYLAKWGVALAPWSGSDKVANDREPSYLFVNAPTSFQWRDLLIKSSRFAEPEVVGGRVVGYRLSQEYMESMSWSNHVGAFFVSVWLYILFLLVVGFGYSYFWTASSIFYLLMRHHVDDTELDEIHLEEDEGPEPFTRELSAAAPVKPPAAPPSGGLTMVEAPALRTALPMNEQTPPPAEHATPPPPAEAKPTTDGLTPPPPPQGNP